MTPELGWLPPMLALSGTWEELVSHLYSVFERDFKRAKPKFQHYLVWWDRRVSTGMRYEEGFWHLISRGDKTASERIPDFRRAERLPWCAPTLIHSDDSAVKVWDYLEGMGRLRTYVWLEEGDYCIVLEKLRRSVRPAAMLITAFHVDGPSKRRNLRRKLANRAA